MSPPPPPPPPPPRKGCLSPLLTQPTASSMGKKVYSGYNSKTLIILASISYSMDNRAWLQQQGTRGVIGIYSNHFTSINARKQLSVYIKPVIYHVGRGIRIRGRLFCYCNQPQHSPRPAGHGSRPGAGQRRRHVAMRGGNVSFCY